MGKIAERAAFAPSTFPLHLTDKYTRMKRTLFTLFSFFCLLTTLAAQSPAPDFMRSIGKIYVVVAVIVAVFLGLVFYLVYLDRKLTKLENQINEHE